MSSDVVDLRYAEIGSLRFVPHVFRHPPGRSPGRRNSSAVRQVSLLIRRELTDRARDFNVIVDDVSITDLTFGKDYTAAVEAKQVRRRAAALPRGREAGRANCLYCVVRAGSREVVISA